MRTLFFWAITCACIAQVPPLPGDGGSTNTNVVVQTIIYTPPVDGAIHTTHTNAIAWWNFDHNVFTVEWREKLTVGSWTNIGEGYTTFEHNAPTGYYRALKTHDVVFPVANRGTDDLTWTATAGFPIECYNTTIPPEWGNGYIVVRAENLMLGTNYITVTAGSQQQQLTLIGE